MSTRPRAIWLGLGVLALLTAVACDASERYQDSPTAVARTPPAATTSAEATTADVCAFAQNLCADTERMERGIVVKIVDGDTFDVTIDGRPERVRIFGIDTAERGDACFTEASERLRALAGGQVRLLPDVRERDRNGRLLRYVYTPSGSSIDALMIAEGMAYAWTRDGALRDPLVALEAQARTARRGCLWGG